jgi:hypothetical protein
MGSRLKEDWKELGVNTVRGWRNKVKDRGWLASKLGTSKEERKGEEKRMIREYKSLHCPEQCGRRLLRERH